MEFAGHVVLEADVLIIGGGSAGLWCAARTKELAPGARVLIVDKGPRDWGGLMAMSGGDLDAVFPGEDVDDWVRDLVYYWDGLCDQDAMRTILSGSYERFRDYERMGCRYRDASGAYSPVPQRHLDHIKLYVTAEKGYGGENMAQAMVRRVGALGVERRGRTLVTDILKRDGAVAGAVGFDTVTGDFVEIRARAVVIAAGSMGWKTSYMGNTSTGEWLEAALRAGVQVQNMEFGKVWNRPRDFSWEGQTTLLPLGARYVNACGEVFMDRYSPAFGTNTDPHYVCLGMAFEARAGRGPIYFDMSALDGSKIDVIKPKHGWQALNYQKLLDRGIDFFNDTLEWTPQLCGDYGGVVCDVGGRTGVPGLYAAGMCRGFIAGVYIGGFALATTAQTGYLTGEAVAADLRGELGGAAAVAAPAASGEVQAAKERLLALAAGGSVTSKEVLTGVQEALFPADVSLIKSAASLRLAQERLSALARLRDQMGARDAHELHKLIEVRGIFCASELYLRASLDRTESRGGHYREDAPAYDDVRWLGWQRYQRSEDGVLERAFAPVPLERYPFAVERHYADNFDFSPETVAAGGPAA